MDHRGCFRPALRVAFSPLLSTPARAIRLARLVLVCLLFWPLGGIRLAGTAAFASGRTVRTITVCVAAALDLGRNEIWMVDMTRIVGDVSQIFQDEFGIRFKIEAYEYWDPGSATAAGGPGKSRGPATLPAMLRALREHAKRVEAAGDGPVARRAIRGRPSACDILVGLVSEGSDGSPGLGIADYLNGIVVLKYPKKKGGLSYVLLHELCHLFGAIDLKEPGTVMSSSRPTFRIGRFTKAIILANRERFFRPGERPLDERQLREAIALYEGRRALALGEEELAVCLGHLKAMLKGG
jgi:hypothetical protein